MILAITGHRPNKLGNDWGMSGKWAMAIKTEIQAVITLQGVSTGITGMALGIDQLFARACRELNIPFIAAIPFKGQEHMWPIESQNLYFVLLQKALYIQVCDINKSVTWLEYQGLIQTTFTSAKMQKRNEWMVDNSDKTLAVWDGTSGGTANCVEYARRKGKLLLPTINPKNLIINKP